MFRIDEFIAQCVEPVAAASLLETTLRITRAITIEDCLAYLSQFPLHDDCTLITLRRLIFDDDNLPILEPDAYWVPPQSTITCWDSSLNVDDEPLARVWVMRGGPPIFIPNLTESALFTDRVQDFYTGQGVRSLYRVLLKDAEAGFAMLTVMWTDVRTFTAEEQVILKCLAWLVAPTVKSLYLGRAYAELSNQLTEAQAQLRDKDTEMHAMAHDLKSPLTTIMATSSILETYMDQFSPQQVTERLQRITQASIEMNNWIQNMLLLAGATKTTDVKLIQVDLAAAVAEAVRMQEALLATSAATVNYDMTLEDLPAVLGVLTWVEHVWSNYISNAVKYGGQQPVITLGAEKVDGTLRLTVRDNGSGVLQEHLERIFEPFMWLPQQPNRPRQRGNGVGLATVKLLVEKMGGSVGVESTPGEGSTFWFTLKLA